jgi:hypothetical protein
MGTVIYLERTYAVWAAALNIAALEDSDSDSDSSCSALRPED